MTTTALAAGMLVAGSIAAPAANASSIGSADADQAAETDLIAEVVEEAVDPATEAAEAQTLATTMGDFEVLKHFGLQCRDIVYQQTRVRICALINRHDTLINRSQAIGYMRPVSGPTSGLRMRIEMVSYWRTQNDGETWRRLVYNDTDLVGSTRIERRTPWFGDCVPIPGHGQWYDFLSKIRYSIRWPDRNLTPSREMSSSWVRGLC